MNIDKAYEKAVIHYQSGHLQQAEEICKKILLKRPHYIYALHLLSAIYCQLRNYYNAEKYLQKAVELDPNNADAYNNLGIISKEEGRLDEAVIYLKKAICLDTKNALAYNNLGAVFQEKEKYDEALTLFQKALQLNPGFSDAYYNLGTVFLKEENLDGAIMCFQKAINLNPRLLDAYYNLGNVIAKQGDLQKAVETFRLALEINPNYALVLNNLGNVLKDQGKMYEAGEYCKRAFEIKSDLFDAYSNYLLFMNYDSRNDAQTIYSEHVRFGKQAGELFTTHASAFTNHCSPDRKLKIGYVSPDFRRHSVNYFLEPVLAAHNHDSFEVYCYSDVMKLQPDMVTARLKGYADYWREIAGLSDEQAAELIRNDRIDLLIDLAGHTGLNRMIVFARKPAPVQVSWLGYPNTTGLSTMDYRIVDAYSDPPGMTDPYYTEKLIRMPESFSCYLPDNDSPEVGPLPVLKSGNITFGSFNIFSKVSPITIELWSEIVKRVPSARLLMKAKSFTDRSTCDFTREVFFKQGIAPERIELLSQVPSYGEHLNTYNRIDIGFDTYPYHGTTTTCEALWMGVPVITLAGNSHASRVGVSLLSNIGLPELIAKTSDEYITIAVNLAKDLKRLQSLRLCLRDMMKHSPIRDAKRFTANLEICYREIWKTWCEST
jgi:protein O-GlcNAc transferase